jgi:hypothetical protein
MGNSLSLPKDLLIPFPVIDVTRGTAFYEAACGMEQQLAEEHRALLQAEAGLEAAKGK